MSLNYNYTEQNPSRIFRDINIAFSKHPVTHDVAMKTGDAAIKQSLRNLVLLNKNEKPFHPEIEGGIYDMLFENFEEVGNTEILRERIAGIILKYEPRVDLTNIDIVPNTDGNAVSINIYYVILNTLSPSNVEIFLKITR
jgi:phage baseplate assembly protein W